MMGSTSRGGGIARAAREPLCEVASGACVAVAAADPDPGMDAATGAVGIGAPAAGVGAEAVVELLVVDAPSSDTVAHVCHGYVRAELLAADDDAEASLADAGVPAADVRAEVLAVGVDAEASRVDAPAADTDAEEPAK